MSKANLKINLGKIGKVSMCKRVLKHQTSVSGDIPFYKISSFGGQAETYISKEFYDEFREKYSFPKKGDILISAAGTLGKTVIYDGQPSYFQDSNIVWIDNDESIVLNSYLYYFYQTKPWVTTNGSTINRIYNDNLRNIKLSIPDIPTQKSIAKVLSDLDAKIELNNKINQELEAMAKTLYDYWFVQFDFPCLPSDYRPSGQVNSNSDLAVKIRAFSSYTKVGGLPLPDGKKWFVYVILCEDGSFYKGMTNDLYRRFYEHYTGQGADWTKTHKPKKIIHWEQFNTQDEARKREEELKTGFGRTWLQREYNKFIKYGYYTSDGLPAHQTRLMPAGKMVYNEPLKREIPEGWEVKELSEISNITMGQSPSGSSYNEDEDGEIFFQGSTDFGWRYPTIRQYTTEPSRMAKQGDILLSVRAPVGTLNIADNNCCIGRGLAALNSKANATSYLFYVMLYFKQIFDHRNNSGTTFGSITKDDLFSLKVIYPKNELLKKYDDIVSKYNETILNNHKQNQELTTLRDWLLPMLMNGQVTLRQAQGKAVKEAEEKLNSSAELSRSMAAEPQVEYKKG